MMADKTVTERLNGNDGNAATASEFGVTRRRRPAVPYVSGFSRTTQASQPESGAGKNEPDSSHIGNRKTLMMA